MKKGFMYKTISCTALLIFMYLAASCSITNEKKETNGIKKSYDNVEEANKSAFADEAMAFTRAAMEADITYKMDNDKGKNCFTVSELLDNFVTSNDPSKYTGIVEKKSGDEWIIYITNGKYSIDGKKFPYSKTDVDKSKEISKSKC